MNIKKVVIVTGGTNKKTEEKELTGKELEKWKKAHGYNTDKKNQSDTK